MSAFKTWWESELSHHYNVASPEEMIAAMLEAFKDTAELGFNAGMEAAAKVCEDDAKSNALVPLEQYRALFIADAIRALKE